MARILIAEDERDIRELIEFTLTAYAGHTIFKAANGAEAVELAPQVMPDLIMMDVRMPRMTGYEACIELKKIDRVKDIPVVFLSAKGQESEIDSGIDAGAYDYILKPFAPDQLAKRVSEILEKFQNAQKSAATSAPTAPPTAESAAKPDGSAQPVASPAPIAVTPASALPPTAEPAAKPDMPPAVSQTDTKPTNDSKPS